MADKNQSDLEKSVKDANSLEKNIFTRAGLFLGGGIFLTTGSFFGYVGYLSLDIPAIAVICAYPALISYVGAYHLVRECFKKN